MFIIYILLKGYLLKMKPEYYNKKNNIIFEEINFIGRNKFDSFNKVKDYRCNSENKLPELNGEKKIMEKI